MAQPTTADIEAVYAEAAAGGLAREQADAAGAPALGAILGGRKITTLTDARSNNDLRKAANLIREEIRRQAPPKPRTATLFQIGEIGRALWARKKAGLPPLPGHERFHTAAGTPSRELVIRARLAEAEATEILSTLRSA